MLSKSNTFLSNFFYSIIKNLQIYSKSDTDIKKPRPPLVKPKPVRPKWQVPAPKEAEYKPVTFEPKLDVKLSSKEKKTTQAQFSVWKPHAKVELESRVKAPEKQIELEFDIPDQPSYQRRVSKRTTEVTRRQVSRSETKMVYVDATSEDSDATYFTKAVRIKKLPPPTPDKLIIDGELYPEKPRRTKRVRERAHGRPKSSKYEPVPYVPGSATIWVPDRKDVLMAAEAWAR